MNDADLDRLLACWEAPAAPTSLRNRVRGRQRPEPVVRSRTLKWGLALVATSVVLTAAIGQTQKADAGVLSGMFHRARSVWFEFVLQPREVHRADALVARIRESNPKVYVDGEPAGRPEFGPAASMTVRLPAGTYTIMVYRYTQEENAAGQPTGWREVGYIEGSRIEFDAGNHRVRIECSQPLTEVPRAVFVRQVN
jgi:hypothetical protein